jgi:hypothetical protein
MRGYVNREWERIRDLEREYAEQELDEPVVARAPQPADQQAALPPVDPKERARQLLGVEPDAGFREIRKAFERLNKRSDPANFPAGSPEAAQATDIQRRVNWAYQVLTENVDVTEKRFKSLEID